MLEPCRVCGGDGRVGNAFGGSATTCPGCRGTGRRSNTESLFHDVTKTKPSHHGPATKPGAPAKITAPTTIEGVSLGNEVKASGLSEDTKAKLIREIIEYEVSHGKCTQTFVKKVRKQIRPAT
ncbi:MAG TPA: molecular chaperone DnaJ [Polyangiaceae bacterium]|nr:molecular chaperone DnaJ [Polyangiaceae bacterium]